MRRSWPIALLLLAVGAGAFAQGLGELAEQERARRRRQPDTAKVFTNDDLPQHAPLASPSPSPSPTARPPAGPIRTTRVRPRTAPRTPVAQEEQQPGPSEVEPTSEAQGPSPSPSAPAPDQAGAESYWRGRAQELRDAVAAAEKRVAEAQTRVDRSRKGVGQPLPIDAMSQVPPTPQLKTSDLVGAEAELEAAQAELARAQGALADLEEEGRRKGALPGWLR